jgi:hypothetical protein
VAVASLTLRARGEHVGGHGREGRRRPDVSPLERLLAELPPTRRRRLQQAHQRKVLQQGVRDILCVVNLEK